MGLVNKTFYHASLDPILLNKEIFHYRDPAIHPLENTKYYMCIHSYVRESIEDNDVQIKLDDFKEMILNSNRKLFNLRISGLRLQSINDTTIIENLGNRIVSLYLIDVFCLTNVFVNSITSYCNNLKTLRLEIIHSTSIDVDTCKPLVHLNSLIFKNCYMSDDQFNKIMLCAPNITHFGVLYSQRFGSYESYTNQKITTKAVAIYLKNTTNIINLESSSYTLLLNLPKNIKLKSLIVVELEREEKLNIPDIQKLILILSKQTTLEHLKMKNLPCCLLVAVSKLYNIKHLHLKVNSSDCSTDKLCLQNFFDSFKNMKYLKTLTIVPTFYMVGLNIIPDCILKSLTTLDCIMDNCLNMVNLSTNLTKLTIRKYRLYDNLSTKRFKLLTENLNNLTHLTIRMTEDDDFLLLSNMKSKKIYQKYQKGFIQLLFCIFRIDFFKDCWKKIYISMFEIYKTSMFRSVSYP